MKDCLTTGTDRGRFYDNVDMVNQEFMLKAEPGIF